MKEPRDLLESARNQLEASKGADFMRADDNFRWAIGYIIEFLEEKFADELDRTGNDEDIETE